jgi:hypothetical protein
MPATVPKVENDRNTLRIQKMMTRIGLGRMARSTGTNDPDRFRDINGMVDKLIDRARENDEAAWAILKDLRDGDRTFLETLDLFEGEGLKGLRASVKTVSTSTPITPEAHEAWLAGKQAVEGTKRSYRACFKALARHIRKGETMADLPDVLTRYREDVVRKGKGTRHFNLTHAMCQSWVKGTQKVTSPVYAELRGVERLKVKKRHRDNTYFSPTDVKNIVNRLPEALGEIVWFQAAHGMNAKELINDGWRKEGPFGLKVLGEKNDHRSRTIPRMSELPAWPLPFTPATYELKYKQYFAWVVAASTAIGKAMGTHDLRRSYLRWTSEAGIPMHRAHMYYGHAPQDQSSELIRS